MGQPRIWEEEQLRKAGVDLDSIAFVPVPSGGGRVSPDDAAPAPQSAPSTVPAETSGSNSETVTAHLPVSEYRNVLVKLIAENQVSIIAGETGSGKTTQLPQFLYETGIVRPGAMLAITQPRRLAAMSVARRVAQEMGVNIGSEVGYSVRFDERTSVATALKFVTDGILLREMLGDPKLTAYGAIMIDEAHERTLSTDVILALARDLLRTRPDFKVVVSSATLNASKFSEYFNGAPVFEVPGRLFPVDILYTKQPEPNYLQAAVTTVFQIHISQELPGDILVFLPGQEEIETIEDMLIELRDDLGSGVSELILAPIYASLPFEQQARIFAPTPRGSRKVVLATNIAETSLTIPGIVYVVDSGLVKERVYNSRSSVDTLTMRECSQASAKQRAGRAGRTSPGKCFRLYTKDTFDNDLPKESRPEVLRTNLMSTTLLLLSLGVSNVLKFSFLDQPPAEAVLKALEALYALGALNQHLQITKLGRILAEVPADPMMAKTLVVGIEMGATEVVIPAIAMLGELSTIFMRPKGRRLEATAAHAGLFDEKGDQATLVSIYNQWKAHHFSSRWCRENYLHYRALKRARDVEQQLQKVCKRLEPIITLRLPTTNSADELLARALISGYFTHLARLSKDNKTYIAYSLGDSVYISSSSALKEVKPLPNLVLYHELFLTTREYMRGILSVTPETVKAVVPHFYYQKLVKSPNTIGNSM